MGVSEEHQTIPGQIETVGNESDQASLTHFVHHAVSCAAKFDHAVLHDV